MSDAEEGEARWSAARVEKSEKQPGELGVARVKEKRQERRRRRRREEERGREEEGGDRKTVAGSCPRVDVSSDINATRQRDTREKSRLDGTLYVTHRWRPTPITKKGRRVRV